MDFSKQNKRKINICQRERERERWKNDMFFGVFIAIYIRVLWSFYHI